MSNIEWIACGSFSLIIAGWWAWLGHQERKRDWDAFMERSRARTKAYIATLDRR